MEKHIPNEKELTDWLNKLPNDPKMGMEVPEGYFNELPDEVMSKVKMESGKKRRTLWYLPVSAIAAAVLLLLWLMPFKTDNAIEGEADLFAELDYLLENEYDLTSDQLAYLGEDVLSLELESYLNLDQPEEFESILEEVAEDIEENYSQLF